jgi:lysophospholipase L1-like esterase
VFTPMLDADGRPRAELFRADALHLNDAGYTLWKAIIARHVR